jgi:hypothetical protein
VLDKLKALLLKLELHIKHKGRLIPTMELKKINPWLDLIQYKSLGLLEHDPRLLQHNSRLIEHKSNLVQHNSRQKRVRSM